MSTKRNIKDYFTPEQIEKRNRQTRNQPKRANSPDQGLINALGYNYDSFYDDTPALNKAVLNMQQAESDRLRLENQMMQSTKGGSKPVSYDDTAALNKAVIAMQLQEAERRKLEKEMMRVPLVSSIFNQTMYPNPVYEEEPDNNTAAINKANIAMQLQEADRRKLENQMLQSTKGGSARVQESNDRLKLQKEMMQSQPSQVVIQVPSLGMGITPQEIAAGAGSFGLPQQGPTTAEIAAGAGQYVSSAGREPAAIPIGQQKGILMDSSGNPVVSGSGNPIGLPTQNPALKAPAGGKGANATPQSAIAQLTGMKGIGGK